MSEETAQSPPDGVEVEVFDDVITIEVEGKRVSLDANAAERVARRLFGACRFAWTYTAQQHPYHGKTLHLSLRSDFSVGDVLDFARKFREENSMMARRGGVRVWRDNIGRALSHAVDAALGGTDPEKVTDPNEIVRVLDYFKNTPGHPILATWEDGSVAS